MRCGVRGQRRNPRPPELLTALPLNPWLTHAAASVTNQAWKKTRDARAPGWQLRLYDHADDSRHQRDI